MSAPQSERLPLLLRPASDAFAELALPHPALSSQPRQITVGRFYQHVVHVAKQLPDRGYAINLCDNRYLFCVAFCAVLLRQQTNLLPPNRTAKTLAALSEKHHAYYLVDSTPPDDKLPCLNFEQLLLPDGNAELEPCSIDADHIAAVCYTSGSTGESKPITKSWRIFFRSTQINSEAYLQHLSPLKPLHQLATVPAQHMWGMETSVLMPLQYNVVMSDARPLYPADVVDALQRLPQPRLLVSTPIHLRALLASSIQLPTLQRTLCATAPLSTELATAMEQQSQGDVVEVYGCSELGSMASRLTAHTQDWTLFRDFSLTADDKQHIIGRAQHIPESAQLGDFLQLLDERHFRISGRTQDLINIGGKRGSLSDINSVLLQHQGVEDGVVFEPQPDKEHSRLAALVVLREGTSREDVLAHFRAHIDSAFVPRPLMSVDRLPRLDNGKLPLSEVRTLYRSLRETTG